VDTLLGIDDADFMAMRQKWTARSAAFWSNVAS
jgi:hypothetical protein